MTQLQNLTDKEMLDVLDTPTVDLQKKWHRLTDKWDEDFRDSIWTLMHAMYGIPERHYHSIGWHIAHMLAEFDKVKSVFPDFTDYWDEIEYSIWMHDVYNNPYSVNNEYNSMGFASQLCEVHTPLNHYAVSWNILATTHCLNTVRGSQTPEHHTPEQKLMCDLDLSGFIEPEHVFAESQRRIRAEYPRMTNEEFYEGRWKFMLALLDRGYIFLTSIYKPYEMQAKKRIQDIIDGKYNEVII